MIEVVVRLFGFGVKASGVQEQTRTITEGTTVRQLWETLQTSAPAGSRLSIIEERKVSVYVNGHAFPQIKKWETVLQEQDTVTFMVLAMGG